MALPTPFPGLVISYAYLWSNEAAKGRREGRKDRPSVIVLSARTVAGQTIVTVAPITHLRPEAGVGIELPRPVKERLGMDGDSSWIVTDDLNRFVWPGPDLRALRRGDNAFTYGPLPRSLYRALRDRVLASAEAGRVKITTRDE